MTTTALFAMLGLLLAPGPTNALMGLAGAERSPRHSALLIATALAGYLITVIPLALMGAGLFALWPRAAIALKLLAAGWTLFLAWKLWRASGRADARSGVTLFQTWITTLLNPKALIFGLVLLPSADVHATWRNLVIFGIAAILATTLWSIAGSLTQIGAGGRQRFHTVQRITAVGLSAVSCLLVGQALSA